MYLITSFVFFLFAGIMALLIRIQLLGPTSNFLSDQMYNELFTMHGTIMLLLFATPLFVGFANELVPLQIGSPDVAFPRLNLLSYYLFTFGGLILFAQLPRPGRLGRVRLVRLRAADQRDELARASARTCGSWAWRCPASARSSAASTSSPRSSACGRRA